MASKAVTVKPITTKRIYIDLYAICEDEQIRLQWDRETTLHSVTRNWTYGQRPDGSPSEVLFHIDSKEEQEIRDLAKWYVLEVSQNDAADIGDVIEGIVQREMYELT